MYILIKKFNYARNREYELSIVGIYFALLILVGKIIWVLILQIYLF